MASVDITTSLQISRLAVYASVSVIAFATGRPKFGLMSAAFFLGLLATVLGFTIANNFIVTLLSIPLFIWVGVSTKEN